MDISFEHEVNLCEHKSNLYKFKNLEINAIIYPNEFS